jgi:phosphoribosylformimino-5-aminoimidazole carboxamide ribotide isomerase
MIAIPALDLRQGACVQLVGGNYAEERVRLEDPRGVARIWAHAGFARLHVVDLDAATNRGSNSALVRDLLSDRLADVQVGGGLRTTDQITDLLDAGARYAVVGTRALSESGWISDLATAHPHEIIVACDVRDRQIVSHGWTRTLPRNILDAIEELNSLPLAGVLVTAVHREGRMEGPDYFLLEDVVESAQFPVYAAGGIGNMGHLRSLADRGVAAAVIGMALYTGALNPHMVAEEFAQ